MEQALTAVLSASVWVFASMLVAALALALAALLALRRRRMSP